jgi:Heterokaryon incompatibility protein (HET)
VSSNSSQKHLKESPRVLWVDAVCINQNDEDEKSEQVSKMREIYGGATKVYAWLGEADREIDCGFAVLQEFRDRTREGKYQPISTLLNNFLSIGSCFAISMRLKPVLYPNRAIWTMTC